METHFSAMGTSDPRIDTYIAKSADFARPILEKNAAARKAFEAFSPSCKREYVDWIVQAKREETRSKRLQQAVEWMAEGKQRHWKYQDC